MTQIIPIKHKNALFSCISENRKPIVAPIIVPIILFLPVEKEPEIEFCIHIKDAIHA
jgi:hypothetical protein